MVRWRLHRADDRQSEGFGELAVALILAGNAHHRTGAVPHQHVVGHEHRNPAVRERDQGPSAQEDPRLGVAAVGVAHLGGAGPVGGHRLRGCRRAAGPGVGGSRRPGVSGQLLHQRMLGRQHHVGGAEQGVGPGGEHLDVAHRSVQRCDRTERDQRPLGAADPVALHGLDRLRPVEAVEVLQQAVGVGGDPHHPLLERALEHLVVASLGPSLVGDFLVGQHRAQRRAPVDRRVGHVGQAVPVHELSLLGLAEITPGPAVGCAPRSGGELVDQRRDRAGPAGLGIQPRVEDLQEYPLGPAVVVDVGGGHAPPLVMAETEPIELAAHVVDVGLGVDPGVLAGLAGVLLSRKAERVESHGVQHVEARHALETDVDVGGDVAQGMADVQSRTRRVREHVHDEELRTVQAAARREPPRRVGRLVDAVSVPAGLPAGFDLRRQRRVVAVRRRVAVRYGRGHDGKG